MAVVLGFPESKLQKKHHFAATESLAYRVLTTFNLNKLFSNELFGVYLYVCKNNKKSKNI